MQVNILLKLVNFDNFLLLSKFSVIANKVDDHVKTSSLASASYKIALFLKIHNFKSVLFITRYRYSNLSFVEILGERVYCDLTRNSSMEAGIRGGYTHTRSIFVNRKTWVAYETSRRTQIRQGLFILISFRSVKSAGWLNILGSFAVDNK